MDRYFDNFCGLHRFIIYFCLLRQRDYKQNLLTIYLSQYLHKSTLVAFVFEDLIYIFLSSKTNYSNAPPSWIYLKISFHFSWVYFIFFLFQLKHTDIPLCFHNWVQRKRISWHLVIWSEIKSNSLTLVNLAGILWLLFCNDYHNLRPDFLSNKHFLCWSFMIAVLTCVCYHGILKWKYLPADISLDKNSKTLKQYYFLPKNWRGNSYFICHDYQCSFIF